jgi:hypothetical protein
MLPLSTHLFSHWSIPLSLCAERTVKFNYRILYRASTQVVDNRRSASVVTVHHITED